MYLTMYSFGVFFRNSKLKKTPCLLFDIATLVCAFWLAKLWSTFICYRKVFYYVSWTYIIVLDI